MLILYLVDSGRTFSGLVEMSLGRVYIQFPGKLRSQSSLGLHRIELVSSRCGMLLDRKYISFASLGSSLPSTATILRYHVKDKPQAYEIQYLQHQHRVLHISTKQEYMVFDTTYSRRYGASVRAGIVLHYM